jgi:NAD(P)-dependent dehydrogenase (short-subunit alcohol dehydrogenase family)
VRDYLNGLVWDGTERLDTMLIRYMAAEDTPYVRAVTRKWMVGAVKRVMQPGCKFDQMLILVGAQGIGKCIVECFRQEGATVYVIDVQQGPWFVGDLSNKATLERFVADVIAKSGKVDVLVNNAMPLFKGIDACTYEEFAYAQAVGVIAPFYLAKLFKDSFAEGASIINISSSRDRMSQPQSESYTAAKGGIAALTHALAASLAGRVRVNSISPGWIDTSFKTYDGPDASQHFAGRVGNPMDIANMVLYLASDKAGFITG